MPEGQGGPSQGTYLVGPCPWLAGLSQDSTIFRKIVTENERRHTVSYVLRERVIMRGGEPHGRAQGGGLTPRPPMLRDFRLAQRPRQRPTPQARPHCPLGLECLSASRVFAAVT